MAATPRERDRSGEKHSLLSSWLQSSGVSINALQLPAQGRAPMTLVVNAAGAPAGHVASTLVSYRQGTVQQLPVQICGLSGPEAEAVRRWLDGDPLVSFPVAPEDVDCSAETVLAVPAGVLFGTHSLEAAYEALHAADGCLVLRAPVDGAQGSVELWRSAFLGTDRKSAEGRARLAGGERWVSGASLGLYYHGRPQPKPHMRRGAAGTLELVVVAEDSAVPHVRQGYLNRIKALESEIARLRKAQWNDALRQGRAGAAATAAGGTAKRLLSKLAGAVREAG